MKREQIEEAAATWAARLDGGGMTDLDRSELATWLDANPEHRWVLARYRELSSEIDVRARGIERRSRRVPWIATLGTLAAAAAIVFAVGLRPTREIRTQVGERHVAQLSDGTQVELNAQTRLSVSFRPAERHVRLLRGEALFQVAKDPRRPFVVETASGLIRVTGTVFNVRTNRDQPVEVTVLEGNVRVRSRDRAIEEALPKGQQAVIAADHVALRTLSVEAARDMVAWRHGEVVLADTPLADALERFAAYHRQPIVVDPAAADLRLGGRFSLDDLDGLLALVERVLPVSVLRDASGAVRITRATR